MTKHIQNLISLENFITIQRTNVHLDAYAKGMLNGMIFSHSIFAGQEPNYIRCFSKNYDTKVRHKSKK